MSLSSSAKLALIVVAVMLSAPALAELSCPAGQQIVGTYTNGKCSVMGTRTFVSVTGTYNPKATPAGVLCEATCQLMAGFMPNGTPPSCPAGTAPLLGMCSVAPKNTTYKISQSFAASCDTKMDPTCAMAAMGICGTKGPALCNGNSTGSNMPPSGQLPVGPATYLSGCCGTATPAPVAVAPPPYNPGGIGSGPSGGPNYNGMPGSSGPH